MKKKTYKDFFEPHIAFGDIDLFSLWENKGHRGIGLVRNGKQWDIIVSPKGNKVHLIKSSV